MQVKRKLGHVAKVYEDFLSLRKLNGLLSQRTCPDGTKSYGVGARLDWNSEDLQIMWKKIPGSQIRLITRVKSNSRQKSQKWTVGGFLHAIGCCFLSHNSRDFFGDHGAIFFIE